MSAVVPETPVEVTVEVEVETPPAVEPEPVVVVTPEPTVTPTDLDHEGRIAQLEVRVTTLEGTVTEVEQTAESAEALADIALDIAATTPEPEVIIEAPIEEPHDVEPEIADESPDNDHPFYRTGSGNWFTRLFS